MSHRREEILRVIAEEGSQAAAAKKLGITKQAVSAAVNYKPTGGKRGPKKGSRWASPLEPRPGRQNGPLQQNKSNLQVPGVYSRAQQELRLALALVNKAALARSLGYTSGQVIRWLLSGAIPAPILRVAVEFEKRYGVRCVDWFEPPVEEEES